MPSLPVQTNVPSLETIDEMPDDDRVWQAAMERAKSRQEREDTSVGTADTDRIPWQSKRSGAENDPDTIIDGPGPDKDAESAEEDWDALLAAANARAEMDEELENTTVELQPDELTDFVPSSQSVAVAEPPPMGAQVEQDAIPANDDMPADMVTSIHSRRLQPPSQVLGIRQPVDDEGDWAKLRADAERTAQAEKERKQRAMREIRRLQQNAQRGRSPEPSRRRFAQGTTNVPHVGLPSPIAARTNRSRFATRETEPAPVPGSDEETRVDLPRITRQSS